MYKIKIKEFFEILKESAIGFNRHKVLKLSASLAYFTIFSLGPMMLVIIFFSDLFWGRQAIEGTIYNHLSGFVGDQAALQIQEIIKNASITGNNLMTVVSFILLLIAATTLFTEMQDSINMIWNLEVKHDSGWWQLIKKRLLSFSIVSGLGFLLLVSLTINGLLEGFMGKLQEMFPFIAIIVVYIFNVLLTLSVVAFLFAIIYKLLPDAIIQWRDV
ncbi:MAG: YihY/virulence factor BrkB family protein, partial [Saprospiraceae bacterium]